MINEETLLRMQWEFMDWESAEENLRDQQSKLSKAVAQKNFHLSENYRKKLWKILEIAVWLFGTSARQIQQRELTA